MTRVVVKRLSSIRDWESYVNGFGDLAGEFWLGLSVIQGLAMDNDQELLILLEEHKTGRILQARYATFNLGLRGDRDLDMYKLTARGHQGTAGDPFKAFQGTLQSVGQPI